MRPSSIQKHEAALAAAERQFLAAGYESVTMDSIAAESGVAKQTLYSHFGSKRELFLELVTSRTVAASDHVLAEPPRIDRDSDPRAVLGAVLRDQLTTGADPCTPQPATARDRRGDPVTRAGRRAVRAWSAFGDRRARGAPAHVRRPRDPSGVRMPELAATQLNWLVMGEPINRAMLLGDVAAALSDAEIERHVDAALDLFLPSVTR